MVLCNGDTMGVLLTLDIVTFGAKCDALGIRINLKSDNSGNVYLRTFCIFFILGSVGVRVRVRVGVMARLYMI